MNKKKGKSSNTSHVILSKTFTFIYDISDTCPYCFIRTRVKPSQRTSAIPYDVWALLQNDKTDQFGGRVINAYCSCTAGLLGCCNQVFAMLFRVEATVMQGLTKSKGIKATLEAKLGASPFSDDTFKRQPQFKKKRKNPKLQNLSQTIRIKCS